MADVSQVITLGIGTPSSIKGFLTFGLDVGVITIEPSGVRVMIVCAESRTLTLSAETRTLSVSADEAGDSC